MRFDHYSLFDKVGLGVLWRYKSFIPALLALVTGVHLSEQPGEACFPICTYNENSALSMYLLYMLFIISINSSGCFLIWAPPAEACNC